MELKTNQQIKTISIYPIDRSIGIYKATGGMDESNHRTLIHADVLYDIRYDPFIEKNTLDEIKYLLSKGYEFIYPKSKRKFSVPEKIKNKMNELETEVAEEIKKDLENFNASFEEEKE